MRIYDYLKEKLVIKKGSLVKIKQVILKKEQRTGKIPKDTKNQDYLMFVKGFLQYDAEIGDKVKVTTMIGREIVGTLIENEPEYNHSYGKYISEFKHINTNIENTKKIDMHVHTRCSDGDLTVREVFELAKESKLSAISITDHDTIKAYETAYDIFSIIMHVTVFVNLILLFAWIGLVIAIILLFMGF